MLSEPEIRKILKASELEREQFIEAMQEQFAEGTWDEEGFEAQSERSLCVKIAVLKRVLGINN